MHFDLNSVNTGNTAWVLASAALVLLMTPGLAFFYGGMVRSKNVLGMLMQNFVAIGIVGVVWVMVAYSLAFGANGFGGFAGNLHQFGLGHMSEQVAGYQGGLAQTIPPLVFMAFQLMFAIITPALITGASADRLKFGAFVAFVTIWIIAAAVAVLVLTNAKPARLFAASAEPALKPNQPNHSSPAPSNVNGRLCGRIGSFFHPSRLPRTIASASPAAPALACTTVPPAKSSAPFWNNQPSGENTQ
jgi:hypothetical protein